MGISATTLKFLVYCKNKFEIDFTYTATLGRQDFAKSRTNVGFLKKHTAMGLAEQNKIFDNGYSEGLFMHLGAQKVDSFDYSDYEGATHVVDMNKPIEAMHKDKYTLLVDGGTTEHIFHVPNVYKNMMDMVKVGGHIVCNVPTNNWCGHGFYQFSPEFYFNLFTKERGFEVKVIAYAVGTTAGAGEKKLWELPNPIEIKKTYQVYTSHETMLFVCAKKTANAPDW